MRRLLPLALMLCCAATALAQDLKSGPYDLPYKNTDVKNIFVSENSFRTMKPVTKAPKPFKEAQKILPAPIWEGNEKEIEPKAYDKGYDTGSHRSHGMTGFPQGPCICLSYSIGKESYAH